MLWESSEALSGTAPGMSMEACSNSVCFMSASDTARVGAVPEVEADVLVRARPWMRPGPRMLELLLRTSGMGRGRDLGEGSSGPSSGDADPSLSMVVVELPSVVLPG